MPIPPTQKAKKVLSYIRKLPLDDKLTANLHSIILETAYGKKWTNEDIGNYLYINTNNGKIHTPMTLVNEQMGEFEKRVLVNGQDPGKFTYLDPHCKTGSYLRWLHMFLTRRSVSEESIQKQVMGVENDPIYIVVARHVSGIKNIGYRNLTDDEKYATFIAENMKKFDVICGNPPFQAPTKNGDKKGGSPCTIWDKFIPMALSMLKDDGYLCYIHPSRWRKPEDDLWGILGEKQMEWLKIYDNAAGTELFGVGTTADCYVLKNAPYTIPTTVIDCEGREHKIDFRKWIWFPSAQYDLIQSIVAKEGEEKCKVIRDRTTYGGDKKWVSRVRDSEFKYPCINSIKSDSRGGITYFYSNYNTGGHFGISKVIMSDNGHIRPIPDMKGEYGMTDHAFALEVSSQSECDGMCKALASDKFAKIVWATKWGNFQTDFRMFRSFRKDFWKEFLD